MCMWWTASSSGRRRSKMPRAVAKLWANFFSLSLSLSQSNFQLPVLVYMSSDKKTNLWQEEKEVWRVPSNHCLLLILFWFSNIQRYNYCCPQIVVDFTATWCGPCRLMAPVFSDLSKKYDILIFLKVDVDEVQVKFFFFFFFFLNFSLFFNIHDHRQAGIALLTLISTMTSSSPQPLLLLLLLFYRTFFFVLCDMRTETILHVQLLEVHCCKVHQIKENQMLLRHVHQIFTCWMHTVCCHHHSHLLFLQGASDEENSNASQTCASDSHIMLFVSAKFVGLHVSDHHHHLPFFATCIRIKCFSQTCASDSHMFVSAKFVEPHVSHHCHLLVSNCKNICKNV